MSDVIIKHPDGSFSEHTGASGSVSNLPPGDYTVFDIAAAQTVSVLWSPEQIQNDLALWLDASDTSTLTQSSGALSQWADKSGHNRHAAQSTASRQPKTGTQTLNSLNIIDFDGSSDFLQTPNTGGVFIGAETIIAVLLRVATSTSNSRRIGNIIGNYRLNASAHGSFEAHTSGRLRPYFTNGTVNAYGGDIRDDQGVVVTLQRSVSDSYVRVYVNGTRVINAGAGTTNDITYPVRVGADFGASSSLTASPRIPFLGRMGEILVLESGTVDQRQTIEGYLAHKWGTQSTLPDDHPHKTHAP